MSWIDYLVERKNITDLYGEGGPSLNSVEIEEIRFDRNAAAVYINFDLREKPVKIPKKWIERKVNSVNLTLMGLSVLDVSLDKWSVATKCNLIISSLESGVSICAMSHGISFNIVVEFLYLYKIDGYNKII